MTHSNLPPGVCANDLPGNSRADIEWEAFCDWALERLATMEIGEARRAVLMGIAAVDAERRVLAEREAQMRREVRVDVEMGLAEHVRDATAGARAS